MLFLKIFRWWVCDWGILLVISLEFQGNKASTVFYDTAYLKRKNARGKGPFSKKSPIFFERLCIAYGCFISTAR